MKRFGAILLVLALVFALAACGGPSHQESQPPASDPTAAPSTAPDPTTAPEPSKEPVVIDHLVTQEVTVTLLGNAIPVTVVRDASTFVFTYQFNGNDVYAKGTIDAAGVWTINETNNDFTVGTLEELLPLIDDSAWVDAPASLPEGAVFIEVEMMGNKIPVTVVMGEGTFQASYSFNGNDVVVSGTVADGVWTMTETTNDMAAMAVPLIQDAYNAAHPADAGEVIEVEMMGNKIPVTVVMGEGTFQASYSFNGNDVVVSGTVADGVWTMTETTNDMAAMAVPLIQDAYNAAHPADAGEVIEVEMMGNKIPVTVVVGEGTFKASYTFNGNDVVVSGTVADGVWTMTETTNDMAAMAVPLIQDAYNAAH